MIFSVTVSIVNHHGISITNLSYRRKSFISRLKNVKLNDLGDKKKRSFHSSVLFVFRELKLQSSLLL